MKLRLSLVAVAAVAAACTTAPGMIGGGSPRGPGAVVAVWVYDGFLSVGEEPIRRRANDNAAIVFRLDRDNETALYKFPSDAFAFVAANNQFSCMTTSDTVVTCNRSNHGTGSFKYKIAVVLRTDTTRRTTLDPFIITH